MADMQPINGTWTLTDEQKQKLVADEAFDQGKSVAQIFSGIFFSGVAAWLSVSNGTKLAFVQKAALEKRLTVCCFLSVYVGFFSAFFNFFQLTAVDDLVLPEAGNFTLDLARPIEWIMTCPLMQLSLVLMGGSKLPEYRRYLMPSFSACILILGTVGAFFGAELLAVKLACYIMGCIVFLVMVWFNRKQIIEYSNGQEGFTQGDSEFRKATILLIVTWAPFPLWYFFSPEGLSIITNTLIVQLGWAFLNIVAKFAFIFYMQRVKDMYCNRLKTKRELQPAKTGGGGMASHGSMSPPVGDLDFSGAASPGYNITAQEYEQQEMDRKKGQLSAVVVETMTFLGMAQHTERFLKLLDRSNMHSIYDVERLNQEQCEELQLPFELVSALQRRLKVWKLEMVDDAEVGLDKGEEFWIKKGLDLPNMDPMDPNMPTNNGMMPYMMPGMVPAYEHSEEHSAKLAEIEELLRQKLKTEEELIHESRSKTDLLDKSVEGLASKFQGAMEEMESRLMSKLRLSSRGSGDIGEGAVAQRSEVRAFETRISAKLDELHMVVEQQRRHELNMLEGRINMSLEQQLSALLAKVDGFGKMIEACSQKAEACGERVEACGAEQAAQASEQAARSNERLEEACRASQTGFEEVLAKLEESLAPMSAHCQGLAARVEELNAQARTGSELAMQKAETAIASQTKSVEAWRQRIAELEANMLCRDEEVEAASRRRHEELLRVSPLRRVDEIAAQVLRTGERTDEAIQAMSATLVSEVHAAVNRVATKADAAHGVLTRQLTDTDQAVQTRLEETGAQVQQVSTLLAARFDALDALMRRSGSLEGVQQGLQDLDAGLRKAFENFAVESQLKTDKAFGKAASAVESLELTLPKRFEEVATRCVADAASAGGSSSDRRVEKALEALGSAHRIDVEGAASNILAGVSDAAAQQTRKATEREERNLRKLEELIDAVGSRAAQKTEDMGQEVKKEIHGFAKRLNNKIPFM